MAKRRVIKIDGGSTLADTASSIRNALNEAGITNMPASVVTGGEIIMASDFNRPAPELTEPQCINVRAV
jgi:hypothetical protein